MRKLIRRLKFNGGVILYKKFHLVRARDDIIPRTDQGRMWRLILKVFLIIGVTAHKLLYIEYLNSAICLLPYLDRYVLRYKAAADAHPALLLLYRMSLQLYA